MGPVVKWSAISNLKSPRPDTRVVVAYRQRDGNAFVKDPVNCLHGLSQGQFRSHCLEFSIVAHLPEVEGKRYLVICRLDVQRASTTNRCRDRDAKAIAGVGIVGNEHDRDGECSADFGERLRKV